MIVLTLTDCPISLRGDLTKWLVEINTGVFVGRVSARVRDNLWKRVVENVKNGRATLVYSTNNEQHMDFRIHHSEYEIIDFDGLKLVMKPGPARTKSLTQRRMGFSKASKMRMIKGKQHSLDKSRNHNMPTYPSNYVILDLETTGLDFSRDEIIEVGMLRVADNKVVETFNVLLIPSKLISKQIEALTGITNELLENEGCVIGDIIQDIKCFIGDSILLGHNIKFDLCFLNKALFSCLQESLDNQYYDTIDIYTKLLNGRKASKKLSDVAATYKINVAEKHRSLADCYTIKAVYDLLRQKIEEQM